MRSSTPIGRRALLGTLAGASLSRGQSPARPSRKPNFLFILADDHAGYVMGCDGNRAAHTPNLDRLSAQSMRFAAHHCNAPVCTPSRQSFFTGQLPHSAGVTLLGTPLSPGKPTLAKQFRQAGYRTAVFGKMHFNRPAAPGLHGFDVMMTEGEITRAWMADVKPRPAPAGAPAKPAQWRPFRDPARIWLDADNLPFARYDEDMRGTYIGRQAIRYLEENRDQPFALWTSFQEPHSPFDFPLEDRGLFDPKQFPVPRVGPEDAWQIPKIFRDLTDDDKRGIIAAYYTSAAFLDRNVGRVLDALRRLGLDDNTFVIYMADHGYDLGQHGRFEKHCGYDPALRVPLLMRYPGRIRAGVVHDLTEHVDVPATIVDLMGLDPLPVMHGRSLRPYLEGGAVGPAARPHLQRVPGKRGGLHQDPGMEIHLLFRPARPPGRLSHRQPHPRPLPPPVRSEGRSRRVHRRGCEASRSGSEVRDPDARPLPRDSSRPRARAAAPEPRRSHRILPAPARR